MAESSWKEFWDRGVSYLRLSERGLNRPDKFNAEALYNIASMAIEGLFMGRFVAAGGLPRNHTLADLVEFEQEQAPMPAELSEALLRMDGFQSLCSLDAYKRIELGREELESVVRVARETHDYLAPFVNA
ncbi:MAG: hypothetical protein WCT14_16590 [Treponemataceae bacterium]